MDEEELKLYIGTLAKGLVDTPLAEPSSAALFHSQCEAAEIEAALRASVSRSEKDPTLAQRNLEDGDSAFEANSCELALLLYSESLKYCPVNGESARRDIFFSTVAQRSKTLFELQKYEKCLQDIELAREVSPDHPLRYQLLLRKCKCLLELGRMDEGRLAFDATLDALKKSGLNEELRQDQTSDLQRALTALAKAIENDGQAKKVPGSTTKLPPWAKLAEVNPRYPAASNKVTIKFNEKYGRDVVAVRDIDVGEVVFHESPIVSYLLTEDSTKEACLHCFNVISDGCTVPCPTCSKVSFCSIACRDVALGSYHGFECQLVAIVQACKLDGLPLVMMSLRAVTQRPASFFLTNKNKFAEHDVRNGVHDDGDDDKADWQVFRSDDYRNLFNLVTHSHQRCPLDVSTKEAFAVFLVKCLKCVGYFDETASPDDEHFIARLLAHFLQAFQFNSHMVECAFSNRLIATDSETRIWKASTKFTLGEFVETVRLGGAIYPTLANVNHSCAPNLILVNWGNRAVALANRPIKAGERVCDTYGAVYYNMTKERRQAYLQKSYWFQCHCVACLENWPAYHNLPRGYLKLSGPHFRYNRCNRKELQKDVDGFKRKIKESVSNGNLDEAWQHFVDWSRLLHELLLPPHEDMVNVRRGLRNCLWLRSPNVMRVREDENLKKLKSQGGTRQ